MMMAICEQSSNMSSTTAIASSSSPLTVSTGATTINQLNLSILNPNQNLLNTTYNRPIGSERENLHVIPWKMKLRGFCKLKKTPFYFKQNKNKQKIPTANVQLDENLVGTIGLNMDQAVKQMSE
jgi:hypothetical protein